jgi:hypothetical protein
MSKYVQTAEEQEAIDFLSLHGYVVIRRRTHDRLKERIRLAECQRDMEKERRESTERWAQSVCDEERRYRDRVVEVCAFAFTHGATSEDLAEFNDLMQKDRT